MRERPVGGARRADCKRCGFAGRCGFMDALAGTCESGKAKGCCIQPLHFVLDEARHLFVMQFVLRLVCPFPRALRPRAVSLLAREPPLRWEMEDVRDAACPISTG